MVINREKRTKTVIEIIPAENIHKDKSCAKGIKEATESL